MTALSSGFAGRFIRNDMSAMAVIGAAALVLAGTIAGVTTTDGNVTWSAGGGSENPGWDVGDNWSGGLAPTNPTAATVTYTDVGTAVTGLIKVNRQIGMFNLTRQSGDNSHALNLGGNTLTVAGNFQNYLYGTLDMTNGTLRVGTETVEGDILHGRNSRGTPGVTRLRPGMTYNGYRVGTLQLGSTTETSVNIGNARLELIGVTVTGGVLGARNIRINAGHRNTGGSYIAVDGTTQNFKSITVTNDLIIGRGHYGGRAFIGDPSDSAHRLPPDIDIRIGSGPTQRGLLEVGALTLGANTANMALSASSGGDIVAYLTDLTVMRHSGSGTATLNGTLDLSAMTNCLIDTEHLEVGVNLVTPEGDPRGTIKLPAGTLTTDTAVIGASSGVGFGRLETSNTVVTVADSLTLDLTGEITINMGDEPKGIDVQGSFTDDGGSIHVNFLEAPAVPESTNWAVRVAGDASATLNAMAGSDRLTASGSFEGWKTGVLYDGVYTYFAMVDEDLPFPPVAVAQDATFEMEPGGTVWVDITEVDAGSHDPADRPSEVRMSTGGGPWETNLSFSAVGEHEVTVRITANGDEDTDTATVHVVDLHPGSPDNRTWLGDDSTVLMDRREWWWSGCWLQGSPPTNPTSGTITYELHGQDVTGILPADWQIGGISTPNTSYAHTVDLGGHALTLAGNLVNALRGTLVFTNGTLRIGSDDVDGSLLLGGSSGRASSAITILRPGMTLDTHRTDRIHIGIIPESGNNNNNVQLDLRGVALARGVLGARDIRLHAVYNTAAGSYIAMDAATAIDRIAVTNDLHIGSGNGYATVGNSGYTFIGDPNDPDRRLPPNVSLRMGSGPDQRGSLRVGAFSAGSSTARTHLSASAGGGIEAYLSELVVMRHTGSGTAQLNGTLDLAAMTNALIDTVLFEVGVNPAGLSDVQPRGTVRLPPGTVTAGTVEIGSSDGLGFGLLTMSNTAFTVTNTLTLARTGDIEVDVGALPTGLNIDNADPGALSMHADATLTLRFFEPAASQPHYGFRWAGNHADTLEPMLGDGRLVIEDTALARPAAIYTLQGDTYVGVPPPPGSLFMLR